MSTDRSALATITSANRLARTSLQGLLARGDEKKSYPHFSCAFLSVPRLRRCSTDVSDLFQCLLCSISAMTCSGVEIYLVVWNWPDLVVFCRDFVSLFRCGLLIIWNSRKLITTNLFA
jgi:hypothetical protein